MSEEVNTGTGGIISHFIRFMTPFAENTLYLQALSLGRPGVTPDAGEKLASDLVAKAGRIENFGLPSEREQPAHHLHRPVHVHRHLDTPAGRPPEPLRRVPLPTLDVPGDLRIEQDPHPLRLTADQSERSLGELLGPVVRRVLEPVAFEPFDFPEPVESERPDRHVLLAEPGQVKTLLEGEQIHRQGDPRLVLEWIV